MQELLTILLLAMHLLAMNLASAGPLIASWLCCRCDERSNASGRRLTWWSVAALFLGIISGGGLIILIPGDSLWFTLQRFPTRAYWFAGGELLFSLACMLLIYWGWHRFNKWAIAALAIVSATNLLYHFPPLMAVIGKLTANPKFASVEVIDRPALLNLMGQSEVMSLTFHFGISAIAVSAIALLHLISRNTADEIQELAAICRKAAGIAFVATLLQVPVGVWLLISLPNTSRMALMGNSLGGSLAFMAAMVLALTLLQRLFAAMLGDVEHKNLRTVVMLTCVVVLLMTTSLRLSRFAVLGAAPTKTASSANARG